MLSRRYSDGVVIFDPTDGRTYSIPPADFEIVRMIWDFVAEGVSPDRLLDRTLKELHPESSVAVDRNGEEARHLSRWIDLALRLQQ